MSPAEVAGKVRSVTYRERKTGCGLYTTSITQAEILHGLMLVDADRLAE